MTRLLDGERPIRTARQHWTVFLPVVAGCVAALVVVGVILKLMPGSAGGRSLHEVKLVIGLATVLTAAVALTLRWLRWRYSVYIVTDRRVVVARGVLSRTTESISLDRIQDTRVRQSLLSRALHAGDVEIESAGRDGGEVLSRINDPQGFGADLLAAVEAHRAGRPYGTPPAPPADAGYVPPRGPGDWAPPPGYAPPPRRDGGV